MNWVTPWVYLRDTVLFSARMASRGFCRVTPRRKYSKDTIYSLGLDTNVFFLPRKEKRIISGTVSRLMARFDRETTLFHFLPHSREILPRTPDRGKHSLRIRLYFFGRCVSEKSASSSRGIFYREPTEHAYKRELQTFRRISLRGRVLGRARLEVDALPGKN